MDVSSIKTKSPVIRKNETTNSDNVIELHNPNDKFENLYHEILHYFETKKPFTDSEFNIGTLSKALNTNSTYISKALNQVGQKKFSSLVNDYRIKQVVEDLNKKKYKRLTLENIYTKAGFTQQSTFNRIFKEYNKITPTEYIENLENLKENGN